jgi:hypothetical protein
MWSVPLAGIFIIPLQAVIPPNEIEAMAALVIAEVSFDELRLHCLEHITMPTTLNLDDYCHRIVLAQFRDKHCGVNVYISSLSCATPTTADFNLAIRDDASLPQISVQMELHVIR